jgi:hypothetical protein
VGVESNWVHSALWPLIGLLYQPQVIMMMEKLVEWLAGETEVLGENLPQWRFVQHKPHMPARTRTWAAAVGSQRLTAWAMAQPYGLGLLLSVFCIIVFRFSRYSLCMDPQKTPLSIIPLLLHDVAISADHIGNTIPSCAPIGYSVWRDVFHCCINVYCVIA